MFLLFCDHLSAQWWLSLVLQPLLWRPLAHVWEKANTEGREKKILGLNQNMARKWKPNLPCVTSQWVLAGLRSNDETTSQSLSCSLVLLVLATGSHSQGGVRTWTFWWKPGPNAWMDALYGKVKNIGGMLLGLLYWTDRIWGRRSWRSGGSRRTQTRAPELPSLAHPEEAAGGTRPWCTWCWDGWRWSATSLLLPIREQTPTGLGHGVRVLLKVGATCCSLSHTDVS